MSTDKDLTDKLLERIRMTDDCWLWAGVIGQYGYGRCNLTGSNRQAHRVVYETLVGVIPDHLVLDHLCRNKLCVNPSHLEPVTSRENTLRADNAPATINSKKTHCDSGHPLSEDNIYRRSDRPRGRNCRECRKIAMKKYYNKMKERVAL